MIGGGTDGLDYKPLNPGGDLAVGVAGSHTGRARGLNVPNMRPGYAYWWERNTAEGDARARGLGYRPAGPGDPEYDATHILTDGDPTLNVGGGRRRADVVLYLQPESAYRLMRKEKEAARIASSADVSQAYLAEKVPLQEEYEQMSGRKLKFVMPGHGTVLTNALTPVEAGQTG